MNALKPCPFCGENVTLDYRVMPNRKHWFITCDCCGMMYQDTLSQRKYVKDGWNNRPIEDDLRKRIVELVSSNMVMAKGVLDLKARIAELEEKQRWIPVSERLPEFNQDVTVIFYDGTISNGHFYESFDFVLEKNNGVYFDDRGRDPQIWHEAIAYWKYEDLPEVQE